MTSSMPLRKEKVDNPHSGSTSSFWLNNLTRPEIAATSGISIERIWGPKERQEAIGI